MAQRRGLDKYVTPAPAPEPPPPPTPVQESVGDPAAPGPDKEKAFESERLMLFGPPGTQKTIAVLAVVGLVVAGIVYWILLRSHPAEAKFPVAGIVFTCIHGGLLGMLTGQLILVYADGIIILFTLMAVFIGEAIYAAVEWSQAGPFVFNRGRFQEVLGICFWAGFVGFWIGFAVYAKRLRDRRRFQKRFSSAQAP